MKFTSLAFLLTTVLHAQDYEIAWEQNIPGTSGFDVTLGDIDGDGDKDALIPHLSSSSVLLLNNGNGVFSFDPDNQVFPPGTAAEFADLDDDGDLDLFLVRHFSPCELWLNDGAGNFTNSEQEIGSSGSRRGLALADIDGDDDLDAILPFNSTTGNNEIWLNNGSGVFSDSGQTLGSAFTTSVDVGDLDDDDDLDIVFGINGRNKIWLNDGSGVFSDSGMVFATTSTFEVALGDLDGDDDLDVFFANGSTSEILRPNDVWLNDGSGVFSDSGQRLGLDYSYEVVLTDVDGDGDLDAIDGNGGGVSNRLWLNNGSGVFSESGSPIGFSRTVGIGVSDLDGDGEMDYFFAASQGPSEVWLGIAAAPFLADSGQRLGGAQGSCVTHGDIDGDGDLDLAMGTTGGQVRLKFNDGTGQFSEQNAPLTNGVGNNNEDVGFGDFDGDGDLDLMVVNGEHSSSADLQNRLWLNDGSGNFTLGTTFPGTVPSNTVAVADLDGDDDLDFVVGNAKYAHYTGQNQIFFNDGSGDFTAVDALGIDHAQDLVLADLDGDDDLDAFIVSIGEANRVWLNDGTGVFSDTGQMLGSQSTTSAVAADFDGDGDLDVACGNHNQSNALWINDGSGNFTLSAANLSSGATRAVGVIDPDGDGLLDVWVGNGVNGPSADWVYQNDGAGSFSRVQTLDSRTSPDLSVGDFTGDGVDDVFVVSAKGDHVLWSIPAAGAGLAAYLAGFGLVDSEAVADPDNDRIPNFLEYASNLDPSVADSDVFADATETAGHPFLRVVVSGDTRIIEAIVIRRLDAPELQYVLTISPNLQSFSEAAGVSVTTVPINSDYERATYRYTVPAGIEEQYGRMEISYVP